MALIRDIALFFIRDPVMCKANLTCNFSAAWTRAIVAHTIENKNHAA
jgi:hypothetical protein